MKRSQRGDSLGASSAQAERMISHRCRSPFLETRTPHSYMFTRFSADCQPVENVSPYPLGTQMRVISLLSHPRPIGQPRVFDHALGKHTLTRSRPARAKTLIFGEREDQYELIGSCTPSNREKAHVWIPRLGCNFDDRLQCGLSKRLTG